MNPIDGLAYGFSVALTWQNFLAAMAGALIGTGIGILPGMSPTVAVALLLVPTMNLEPETGLIMLGAIYYGSQYGDSMTAILMGVPSEAPSVVIGIDGYQIAKKGRAGAALAVSAIGSFIGATVGLVGLILLAEPVSDAALSLGPPEYAAITVLGLFVLSRMSSSSFWMGLAAVTLGLMFTTVGMDPLSGQTRFIFGHIQLAQGIELIPSVMGLIGMAEMLEIAAKTTALPEAAKVRFRELFPTWQEWREAIPASLRGAGLGFVFGLLPGPSLTLATFAAYRFERRLAPREVGHGSVRAVAGPKSADDGAISGTLVPLMSLGIPFTAVTAVLFAGLMLHGIQPGPALMVQQPQIFWGLVAAMYVGNVALLVMNFPLVGMWMSLLRIPQPVLSAILVMLMMIGAFSLRNSILDIGILLVMGVLGYLMKQFGFDRTLVILGLVLGPMLEMKFRESMEMSGGDLSIFVNRSFSLVLLLALVAVLLGPPLWRLATRGRLRLLPLEPPAEKS